MQSVAKTNKKYACVVIVCKSHWFPTEEIQTIM